MLPNIFKQTPVLLFLHACTKQFVLKQTIITQPHIKGGIAVRLLPTLPENLKEEARMHHATILAAGHTIKTHASSTIPNDDSMTHRALRHHSLHYWSFDTWSCRGCHYMNPRAAKGAVVFRVNLVSWPLFDTSLGTVRGTAVEARDITWLKSTCTYHHLTAPCKSY